MTDPQENYESESLAMPLWDSVRFEIFNKYQRALENLRKILFDLNTGNIARSKDLDEFNGWVFALYIDLKPKFKFGQFSERNRDDAGLPAEELVRIREMNLDLERIILSGEPSKNALPIKKSIAYFILMRDVIEALGITKVEFKKVKTGQHAVGAIGEGR